jgi:hypothetical protein
MAQSQYVRRFLYLYVQTRYKIIVSLRKHKFSSNVLLIILQNKLKLNFNLIVTNKLLVIVSINCQIRNNFGAEHSMSDFNFIYST